MKTIDCALAQDLMPLYTEGMLSPESREALEEHLAGCEACRRTADEMCHPLLEPQFQEEARLLRRLRRRRKALWAAVIVLAALLVLSGILRYTEARYTAQALTPRLTRLSIPSQAVQESYTAEDGSVVIQKVPNQKYLYYFLLRSSSKDIPLKLTEGKVYGFYDGQLYQLNAQFYIHDTSKGVLPLGYESRRGVQQSGSKRLAEPAARSGAAAGAGDGAGRVPGLSGSARSIPAGADVSARGLRGVAAARQRHRPTDGAAVERMK